MKQQQLQRGNGSHVTLAYRSSCLVSKPHVFCFFLLSILQTQRALGNAVSCDRRRRALHAVAGSCLSLKSSLIDVLVATAKVSEPARDGACHVICYGPEPGQRRIFLSKRPKLYVAMYTADRGFFGHTAPSPPRLSLSLQWFFVVRSTDSEYPRQVERKHDSSDYDTPRCFAPLHARPWRTRSSPLPARRCGRSTLQTGVCSSLRSTCPVLRTIFSADTNRRTSGCLADN